ncbi:hypothetical protein GQ54DRAFT_307399, partial [Martensiomyces pterosporus]
MVLLDELPLDILLAAVKWLCKKLQYEPAFRKLLPMASVSTRLRRSLLPLPYRDLVFESPVADTSDDELSEAENNASSKVTIHTRHNAALAHSAGCSECVQRVSLFTNRHTDPDDIVRAVQDDMDAGSETKWPNLRSYTYNYEECLEDEGWISCSDVIRQLDKELPKLRQASPATCGIYSGVVPLAYTPPWVSFLTQLTSLCLDCHNQCIDANRFPQIFAPTLVDLTLYGVNPENVWNAFYDGQKGQTVVFARLKRLTILYECPLNWGQNGDLPPHLQGATRARAASDMPDCRVPLFPVLCTFDCQDMAYNFHDFISRTQCHNSLVSLRVYNEGAYFDFDAELFKNLETVMFSTRIQDTDEERTGSVDLYKSAFTSLLRTKTNIQRMSFISNARDTLFQVPAGIGCANLRSLLLGVEVDLKSILRLLSNLKHLVELELDVNYAFIYDGNDGQEDTVEYIDELQPPQA